MQPLAVLVVATLALARGAFSLYGPFYDPQIWPNRSGIVHLFEWKWQDIAKECERFLAPKGYAAVQISPPTENLVVRRADDTRPWWERYQPISYRLITRSGNESEFEDMTRRCNKVGIRIYVDLVINHMTGNAENCVGTGNSSAGAIDMSYPAVPFETNHFHKPQCAITNWTDPVNVRNCEYNGLHDLDHSQPYVRGKIVDLLNHLIDLGVAGFRVDSAKLMWPNELLLMFEATKPLNTSHGFAPNTKPFVYQEVVDYGGDPLGYNEYTHIGRIADYKYSAYLSRIFLGDDPLKLLRNLGNESNLVPWPISVVFVDNHVNQRDQNNLTLNYKRFKEYRMAVAFMLAHPLGLPRVMSSFYFDTSYQGPPVNKKGELASPIIDRDGACGNFVCEHRWRQIYNMVAFRNIAADAPIQNWWDNGDSQMAFSRGDKAFIAFNNENKVMDEILPTGLPEGIYCDIISGNVTATGRGCTGKVIKVGPDTKAKIYIAPKEFNHVVATHIGARTT